MCKFREFLSAGVLIKTIGGGIRVPWTLFLVKDLLCMNPVNAEQ